jgi:ribonuclease R
VIVTVAIADVAAYVRPGSALDREAQKRGNSVYFPDRVVPMLPERISNDLCSLREGEDRPAWPCAWCLRADGRKLRHSFHRIVMRSAAKLSYSQAQAAIDGAPDEATGRFWRRAEAALGRLPRPQARARGAPSAGTRPARAPHPAQGRRHGRPRLRARTPRRAQADRGVHDPGQCRGGRDAGGEAPETRLPHPRRASLAKQEALREFLQTIGISLARGAQLRPKAFNAILEKVEGTENDVLVNEVVLRTQSQAAYETDNIGHFGLNLHRYAHFTSPIRRYADLIVHRALIAALGLGEGGITQAEEDRMEEVAALISAAERRAMAAERDTVDRLVAAHLSGRIGEVFEGRVAGVTKAGLFVKLPEYAADGFVPVSTLGDDYYIYDEASQALAGERPAVAIASPIPSR